jgi:adenylosuccinate synthase
MTQPATPPTHPQASEAVDLGGLPLLSDHCAVVGMQWGDEGKGKVVDLLAAHFDLIARYNGGANAGHSVQVGETRYALHLIPSGILYADKTNVIGNGVVVDPAQLTHEVDALAGRGVDCRANLRLSDRAHVVMPYHKTQDALMEAALAKSNGSSKNLGTTGRGIGPCYADKALRSTAIRVGDLLRADELAPRLAHILRLKNLMLAGLAKDCQCDYEPLHPEALLDQCRAWGDRLRPYVCDTSDLLHEQATAGKRILFEGANATLLDIDHGTYPYVTSSNCSSLGVHSGTGIPGHMVKHVLGIVKAYQTRVGSGPMPTELTDATGERIRVAGNEFGTTTGRPRRCGWLDLVALRYATRLSGATAMGLMLLDVLAELPEVKLCTAYRDPDTGQELQNLPADSGRLQRVEPVYRSLPGFGRSISGCRTFAELPEPARDYVDQIERHVGIPVRMISVGPRRCQTFIKHGATPGDSARC